MEIVLLEWKVIVYKIENLESDLPSVTYVDNKWWDVVHGRNGVVKENLRDNEELLQAENDHYLGTEEVLFGSADLQIATAMTIVPVFAKLDHQLIPDRTIVTSSDGSLDYEDDSWTEDNLAARPQPGGKWFHHILITHKAKRPRLSTDPPMMTVLRILEDGKLIHLMTGDLGRGQFANPELKKDVVSMASFTAGLDSYFVTASKSTYPQNLPHAEYSVVEAFKLEEHNTTITEEGIFANLEPVNLDQKIQVFNVVEVVDIDFLTHKLLAVLDDAGS